MLQVKLFIQSLFQRDPNRKKYWRLFAAIVGVAFFEFLINYNLAIHASLAKLKLPEGILEWVDLMIGTDWSSYDFIWLGLMALVWLIGFSRLLRLGLIWYTLGGTLTVITSVIALIITVAFRDDDVWGLLWDAVLVWVGNVVVFASWYWLIDAPHAQSNLPATETTKRWEFLFPQRAGDIPGWGDWQARFFDYLFLAFTTATAFSPTETAPLSRRAKVMVMLQSIISLIVIAVLAARAINILKPPA